LFLSKSVWSNSYIQSVKNSETGRRGTVTKNKGIFIKCSKGTFLSSKVIQQKITCSGHTREVSVWKWGETGGKCAAKSTCDIFWTQERKVYKWDIPGV